MKIRSGFVSNSSSTAFIIWNKTNENKTLVDFVKENPQLLKQFIEEYNETDPAYILETMIQDAINERMIWAPNEKKYCVFGDEKGPILCRVFD